MFIGSRRPKPWKVVSSSLWDTNYEEEGILTMQIEKNEELLNNVTLNTNNFVLLFLF